MKMMKNLWPSTKRLPKVLKKKNIDIRNSHASSKIDKGERDTKFPPKTQTLTL